MPGCGEVPERRIFYYIDSKGGSGRNIRKNPAAETGVLRGSSDDTGGGIYCRNGGDWI